MHGPFTRTGCESALRMFADSFFQDEPVPQIPCPSAEWRAPTKTSLGYLICKNRRCEKCYPQKAKSRNVPIYCNLGSRMALPSTVGSTDKLSFTARAILLNTHMTEVDSGLRSLLQSLSVYDSSDLQHVNTIKQIHAIADTAPALAGNPHAHGLSLLGSKMTVDTIHDLPVSQMTAVLCDVHAQGFEHCPRGKQCAMLGCPICRRYVGTYLTFTPTREGVEIGARKQEVDLHMNQEYGPLDVCVFHERFAVKLNLLTGKIDPIGLQKTSLQTMGLAPDNPGNPLQLFSLVTSHHCNYHYFADLVENMHYFNMSPSQADLFAH